MYPETRTIVVDSPFEMDCALLELEAAPIIALDCETTGLDPTTDDLVLLQLATPEVCFLFGPGENGWHNLQLHNVLKDATKTFLIQYAPFDSGWVYAKLGILLNATRIYDTRRAEQLLGKRGRGLKDLAQKYLGVDLDKSARLTFTPGVPLTPEQAVYAATDALILFPIMLAQAAERYAKTFPVDPALQAMKDYVDGRGPKPERD